MDKKDERKKNEKPENIRIKYQVAVNKNISESEIQWSRYNVMIVVNTLIIGAIGTLENAHVTSSFKLLSFILPVFGLVLCYLWFITTWRGFQWITFWAETSRKLEEQLKDSRSELNPFMNGLERKKLIAGWPSTGHASYLLILLFAATYLAVITSGCMVL